MTRPTAQRRTLLILLAAIVSISLIEAVSYVGGELLDRFSASVEMTRKSEIYRDQREDIRAKLDTKTNDLFDPDLGWIGRPDYRDELYSNNSIGLRGKREYPASPPDGVLRITAFGDSFVYGNEVGDDEVWTHQLEQLLPNAEVLNFGVGGYGTDQALLRYRKIGKHYTRDVVFIGFAPVDLRRNVNVYRRFISTHLHAHFKPRFQLGDDGELERVPMPVAALEDYQRYYDRPELIIESGALDDSYRPWVYENPLYDHSAAVRLLSQVAELISRRVLEGRRLFRDGQFDSQSEAFKITQKILEDFHAEVVADGATSLILMFPEYEAISGDSAERSKFYQPLMDALRGKGLQVLDLADAFVAPAKREDHFMSGGHYSAHANSLIARHLADYLSEHSHVPAAAAAAHHR